MASAFAWRSIGVALATRVPFLMLVPGNPARFWAGVLCALAVPPRTVKHTTTTSRHFM